jgi:hypothetical protein
MHSEAAGSFLYEYIAERGSSKGAVGLLKGYSLGTLEMLWGQCKDEQISVVRSVGHGL